MVSSQLLTLAAGQAPQQSNPLFMLGFFALMFGGMYFLMIAPQRKKQKEHEEMVKGLKAGDEVLTSSGIYGKINSVKDGRIVVTIGESTKVEINPAFVQQKIVRAEKKDKA